MLGFTTLQVGNQTFLRFADGIIDANCVCSVKPDDEDPRLADVWLKGNDGDPDGGDTEDYRFAMLSRSDGATIFFAEDSE